MFRNKTGLCLMAAMLLSSACSPSVVRVDLDQGPTPTPDILPTATAELEPTPTEGILDCGSDLDCFSPALSACQPSILRYTQAMDLMGAQLSNTLQIEALGPDQSLCQFSLTTVNVSLTYSEEALTQLRDGGMSDEEIEAQRAAMEGSQREAGFDEVCSGDPADLIQLLQRWEQGQYSLEDWSPFSCQGKIFTALEPVPEPAQLPTETAAALLPEGGNLLANASFEFDPQITAPRWMADAKNTDLSAEWSGAEANLGEHSLSLTASQSGNQGFPGWFTVDVIPIQEQAWHLFEAWAMSPDGGDAFVSVHFLDQEGEEISSQSSGPVNLDPGVWTRVGFGIQESRFAGVSGVRLGLQQCLSETEGTQTHLYYDQIYFGTTPP